MPLISIITICYNEEKNIRKTCESIKIQTFDDFEWIVIDGASTDHTLSILKEYDEDIATLISEPDKGIYNAMNKGISQANGDYLLFLNGGDSLYNPDTLKCVATIIQKDKKKNNIYYGEIVDENDNYILNLKDRKIDWFYFSNMRFLHHQATLIKAKLFDEIGLYDEKFKIVADYDWFLRYHSRTKNEKLKYIDEKVSYFDNNGISSDLSKRYILINETFNSYAKNIKRINLSKVTRLRLKTRLHIAFLKHYLITPVLKITKSLGYYSVIQKTHRKYRNRAYYK